MSNYGDSRYDPIAILPTATQMNPYFPNDNEYWNVGQTAFVLRRTDKPRTRATRVVTSYGSAADNGWNVGDTLYFMHDQTRAFLGEYVVEGIHEFSTHRIFGDVGSRSLPLSVCK